jgi:PAS domain S-box-containing protein
VVALPLLSVVVTTVVFIVAQDREQEAQVSVDHTLAVKSQLNLVTQLVLDVESGARGFIITGEEVYLRPFRRAERRLPGELDRLDALVADNPDQRDRAEDLRRLVEQRVEMAGRAEDFPLLTVAVSPALAEAVAEGTVVTDRIREIVEEMDAVESDLLAARQARASRAGDVAVRAAAASLVLGLLGGVVASLLFARGIGRRLVVLQGAAADLVAGEPVDPGPAARDEVGRVAIDLERSSRLLADARRYLEGVIAASPDIVATFGPDGILRTVSPAAEDILGYPDLVEMAKRGEYVTHPDDQAAFAAALRAWLEGESQGVALRYRARHRDGHWVTLEGRGRRLVDEDGETEAVVMLARDVSVQADLEETLRQARLTAESANQSKSEFLSRMSHELRTPLNAVLGFAQLLELEDLDAEAAESVQEILRGGRHLLDLINEVLDIARIETGRMALSLETVSVSDVVADSVALCRPLAQDRAIALERPGEEGCDRHVRADRQRLKQILLNLIGNAVKYNRPNGSVAVTCRPVDDDRLRIQVADTGPGVPEEHLGLLFAPFERLGAEQTDIEGSGVGLTLSQHLAEAMGGSVGVESVVGQGSTFWIDLPLVDAPESVLVSPPDGPTTVDGSRPQVAGDRVVLHIEDNAANLRLVERVLAEQAGMRVLAAGQGERGVDLAAEHRPDVILLDLHLPDLDGDEVLRRLQADPATAEIPVLVVSADATPGRIRELLASGAVGYVTKPIDVGELLTVIDGALT